MAEQDETQTSYRMQRSDVQLGDATDNWEIVKVDDDGYADVLAVLQTETLAELFLQALAAKE